MSGYPNSAGYKEESTSKTAAQRIEASGRAGTLRERVRAYFMVGFVGTADEMAQTISENPLSVRPRVAELNRLGVIERTGETRPSLAGGRQSHVWRRRKA